MTRLLFRCGVPLAAALVCVGLVWLLPAPDGASAQQRRADPPACADCHGTDFGGRVLIDDLVVGRIVAPNLTRGRGGAGASYSRDDWYSAVHGTARDGRTLILMPARDFAHFDRADVAMLTSRLGTLRPVERELPQGRLGPVGRALQAASPHGLLPGEVGDRLAAGQEMPKPGSAAYGNFLMAVGCAPCHGESLRGASIADHIVAPDLGPNGPTGAWTEDQFVAALRTGLRPDRSAIGSAMPIHALQELDESSARAIWLRLR